MPRREDIRKILIIGTGPALLGQACELDFAGAQAIRALKEENYTIVLINPNPTTTMTDPDLADRTYLEPLTPEILIKVIERERPDALWPALGSQPSLNLTFFLAGQGILDRFGIQVIGVGISTIDQSEDRELFKRSMMEIGLKVAKSGVAATITEGMKIGTEIGFPLILRPAFTLGGIGGSTAYNPKELEDGLEKALMISPARQVLVEESLLGWKEIEYETLRDSSGHTLIVTSLENIDPMGVHTGDSAAVVPGLTIGKPEQTQYAELCGKILDKIGLSGGSANIQFAVHPETGEIAVVEVNPRLSRTSALASKALGFPMAKLAAKLAVGYSLKELGFDPEGKKCVSLLKKRLPNMPVIFKAPRFTADRFPGADRNLDTTMKSVGEVMALGSSLEEAIQKALRGLALGHAGLGYDGKDPDLANLDMRLIRERLHTPNEDRLFYIRYALEKGIDIEEIRQLTGIDRIYIQAIANIVSIGRRIRSARLDALDAVAMREAKVAGFSDLQIAYLTGSIEAEVTRRRRSLDVVPSFVPAQQDHIGQMSKTYYYASYRDKKNNAPLEGRKIVILGGGPNRIGQGSAFDYCCVHAAYILKEMGVKTIMINCNPEALSTDIDISDKLYFEPLTFEDVLPILEFENPDGVITWLGGQGPREMASQIEEAGFKVLGTPTASVDIAEDRENCKQLLKSLGINQPDNGTAADIQAARHIAERIGYPVVVRPTYSQGSRAMQIIHDEKDLEKFLTTPAREGVLVSIWIDKFLNYATEVDVDAISDGAEVLIAGIMEHIEEAGVHSGDSACVLPPHTLSRQQIDELSRQTKLIAETLHVAGPINVQFAIKGEIIYVLGVTPRASRTIPLVSKATGIPIAKLATQVMMGKKLAELRAPADVSLRMVAVKEVVFPFIRFPDVDPVLGPTMKSTGEVMGFDRSYGMAFAKAQHAAGQMLPTQGTVLFSLQDTDKKALIPLAKRFLNLGFTLMATQGTADVFQRNDILVTPVLKRSEGRPHVVDKIINREVQLIINTPSARTPKADEMDIRRKSYIYGIPLVTTVSGAYAAVDGIEALIKKGISVRSLQEELIDN